MERAKAFDVCILDEVLLAVNAISAGKQIKRALYDIRVIDIVDSSGRDHYLDLYLFHLEKKGEEVDEYGKTKLDNRVECSDNELNNDCLFVTCYFKVSHNALHRIESLGCLRGCTQSNEETLNQSWPIHLELTNHVHYLAVCC